MKNRITPVIVGRSDFGAIFEKLQEHGYDLTELIDDDGHRFVLVAGSDKGSENTARVPIVQRIRRSLQGGERKT